MFQMMGVFVPDDGRVRRVRAGDDPGAGARRPAAGQGRGQAAGPAKDRCRRGGCDPRLGVETRPASVMHPREGRNAPAPFLSTAGPSVTGGLQSGRASADITCSYVMTGAPMGDSLCRGRTRKRRQRMPFRASSARRRCSCSGFSSSVRSPREQRCEPKPGATVCSGVQESQAIGRAAPTADPRATTVILGAALTICRKFSSSDVACW
jgi:hypothetical protein